MKLMHIHYERGILSPHFADVFIASFSAAEDLKSQWIDYGMSYKGVSIAFDLRHARPSADSDSSTTLAPCVYEKHKQEELIREPLNRFLEPFDDLQELNDRNYAIARVWPRVRRIWPDAGDPPYKPVPSSTQIRELLLQGAKGMNRDLFVLASHLKNPKFKEEHEWRLVLPRSRIKDNAEVPIKYRKDCWKGEQVNKPFIELGLQMADADRLPIVRVMTGPRCDASAVKVILESHGYHVPICPSKIPVR
jgi:hypothetical protein